MFNVCIVSGVSRPSTEMRADSEEEEEEHNSEESTDSEEELSSPQRVYQVSVPRYQVS